MNRANRMVMMMMMGSSQGGRPKRERRRGNGDREEGGRGPWGAGHDVFPSHESLFQATRARNRFNTLGTSRGKSSLINPAPKASAHAP